MSTLLIKDYVVTMKNANKKIIADEITIVKGLNTQFESGKLNAIMGPNGCGKTTMMTSLYGVVEKGVKTTGKILLDGEERTPDEWFEKVSIVEQSSYFPTRSTVKSIFESTLELRNAKFDTQLKLEDFDDAMEYLYVKQLLDTKAHVLSGGEYKRVAITCGIMLDRDILILDEPTSDLDSHIALNLMFYLKELAKTKSKMIIFTIHQPSDQIVKLFDNILFISGGSTLYSGPLNELNQFLNANGIVKPDDWTMSDFLFEAFYHKSIFPVIQSQREAIGALVSKIEYKTTKVLQDACPTYKGKTYISIKTSVKEVAVLVKRDILMALLPMFFYIMMMANHGLMKIFKKMNASDAINGVINDIFGIETDPQNPNKGQTEALKNDELAQAILRLNVGNPNRVKNIFTDWINDVNISKILEDVYNACESSMSIMITPLMAVVASNIVTLLRMRRDLPVIEKEIKLSYYKPITLFISILILDLASCVISGIFVLILYMAIGVWNKLMDNIVLFILTVAVSTPFIGLFYTAFVLLTTSRMRIAWSVGLCSTTLPFTFHVVSGLAVTGIQKMTSKLFRTVFFVLGSLLELFPPSNWLGKYFQISYVSKTMDEIDKKVIADLMARDEDSALLLLLLLKEMANKVKKLYFPVAAALLGLEHKHWILLLLFAGGSALLFTLGVVMFVYRMSFIYSLTA